MEVVNQLDNDPQIQLDTQKITHAFVALNLVDTKYSDVASNNFTSLGQMTQPRIWSEEFKAKFMTFSVNPLKDIGDPDPILIIKALQSYGLKHNSVIVITYLTISFDGGPTHSNIGVGFAFTDDSPKIILARIDGCKPSN